MCYIQSFSVDDKIAHLVILINNNIAIKLEKDLTEESIKYIMEIFNIVEVIINSFQGHSYEDAQLSELIRFLLEILDQIDFKNLLKKYKNTANLDFQKIPCEIIKLCMILGDLVSNFDYTEIINSMTNILAKCKNHEVDRKNIKLDIIQNCALLAKNYFILKNRREKNTFYNFNLHSTIFYNDIPNDFSIPSKFRKTFFVNDRIMTLIEHPIENDSYKLESSFK